VRCPACSTDNDTTRKFCRECGGPLALRCPACGTGNAPSDKFCGECGAALTPAGPAAPAPPPEPAARPVPASERRLVSVLFADLVGFTTVSERRDAEDVQELLTRYFEEATRLVDRYGGVVEKFIGDAVMAVWGTPTAQEDDAERAVRAALDLVEAVVAMGSEVGAPDLEARAGVLTGEAAVTLGVQGQGMVAGDLVNTAARTQAAAEPGTVLVGEATRRASEAAVVYADAGDHRLKGKADPVRLWRAVRVVAGVGGTLRSSGLEAPFVGRDRELRLVKELFHATAEEGRARLVSVEGVAGIGKSRLAWEFEKYIDGLQETVWWHRGRCLAYGEGVTYWALAEMVRRRAGILEGEEPVEAAAMSQALTTKANILIGRARPGEGFALLSHALQVALDNGLWSAALRARNNLSFSLDNRDRHEEALEHLDQGLALARKVGNRLWEGALTDSSAYSLYLLGRWDEVMALIATTLEPRLGEPWTSSLANSAMAIHAHRGQVASIRPLLTAYATLGHSADVQTRAGFRAGEAITLRAEGRHAEALAAGEEAMAALDVMGPGSEIVKQGLTEAAEAALSLGDLGKVEELLALVDRLPPGQRPPYLQAQAARFRARLAAARDEPAGVAAGFKAAAGLLRELQMPFWLAVTLLEHGEWLTAQGRPADAAALLEEAASIFERLQARPWTERLLPATAPAVGYQARS